MKIYVARSGPGDVIAIVAARTQELAEVYWHGQGLYPNTITPVDLENIDPVCKVMPILKTRYDQMKKAFMVVSE